MDETQKIKKQQKNMLNIQIRSRSNETTLELGGNNSSNNEDKKEKKRPTKC